ARRLDRRPGPWCGPRRRTDRLRGHAGRPRGSALHPHRRAPGQLRGGLMDDRLVERDRDLVWHPYAPMPASMPPVPVVGARGTRRTLADGREVVDGMSSWWAAIHGYRHPVLDEAVVSQLGHMSHVMFGGLTHAPAVELAEQLVEIAPSGLEHVFF